MKKLLSLSLCLALILSVIAVNAISFNAEEATAAAAEEVTDATVDCTAEVDMTEAEPTEAVETTASEPELAPVREAAELQETGIVPENIGNSVYVRVKMVNHNGYNLTSPSKVTLKPFIRKLNGYTEQAWHLTREGEFYRIRSVTLNSYIEMSGSEAIEGDALCFAAKRNAAEQKWIITKNETGYQFHSFVDNNYVMAGVNPTASASSVNLTADQTNADTYFNIEVLPITADKLPTPVVKLANGYSGVLIDWNDIANAVKYCVYRYNDSTKKWDVIATPSVSNYTDTKVTSGKTYKYAVRTVNPVLSDFKAVSIYYIAAPRLTISNNNDGPTLSWKKVNGAPKYRVFVKNGKSWKTLVTTTGTSYLHKAAEFNKTYVYTVRCLSADGKTYISGYNTAGVSNMIVKTPVAKVTVMPFSLDVSWAKVTGAAKYRVFVKSKATGNKWVIAANVAGNSYRYSNVTNNTGYYFTVRALNSKGQIISGFKSTSQTYFFDVPVVKTITTGTKANKLTWYPVPGAVKYRVFAWNGKKWIVKGTTAAYTTSFNATVTGTKAQNICYAVRAMNKNGALISSYLATVIEGTGLRYYFPGEYTATHIF